MTFVPSTVVNSKVVAVLFATRKVSRSSSVIPDRFVNLTRSPLTRPWEVEVVTTPGFAFVIADTITGAHLYLVNRTARKLARSEETRKKLDLDLERQLAKLEQQMFS